MTASARSFISARSIRFACRGAADVDEPMPMADVAAAGGWRLAPPDMQISVAIAANYSSAVQVLTEQLLVFIGVPMGL